MKNVAYPDSLFRRAEKLAEAMGTSANDLFVTMAEDVFKSMEAQLLDMEKRVDRAVKNKDRNLKTMQKIFAPLTDEDRVTVDPAKADALADEMEANMAYNLKVSRQTGKRSIARRRVA